MWDACLFELRTRELFALSIKRPPGCLGVPLERVAAEVGDHLTVSATGAKGFLYCGGVCRTRPTSIAGPGVTIRNGRA
jgi:hypothetical protein